MPDAQASLPLARGGVMLADGAFFEGAGFGASGSAIGEVCFNTAMTGYQEIISDPSYAGQIIAFTFPHIGIVGTNGEDIETLTPAVRGLIVRADAEHPSNYRSLAGLDRWLKAHNIPAVAGIDTRALTSLIREKGMPHGVIANAGSGQLDRAALLKQAKSFSGLEGLDLAKDVSTRQTYKWREMPWAWNQGYGAETETTWRATVIDYGVKRNILRLLAGRGADITVVPANADLDEVMRPPSRRCVVVQRPGRSRRDRRIRHFHHQGRGGSRRAFVRHLPGSSDAGASFGRENQKDGPGPSRRQSSCERSGNRQGRDRLDESRLHRGPRHAAQGRQGDRCSRCSTAPIAASRSKAKTCSASSITPKPRRGPWTAIICSTALPAPPPEDNLRSRE